MTYSYFLGLLWSLYFLEIFIFIDCNVLSLNIMSGSAPLSKIVKICQTISLPPIYKSRISSDRFLAIHSFAFSYCGWYSEYCRHMHTHKIFGAPYIYFWPRVIKFSMVTHVRNRHVFRIDHATEIQDGRVQAPIKKSLDPKICCRLTAALVEICALCVL